MTKNFTTVATMTIASFVLGIIFMFMMPTVAFAGNNKSLAVFGDSYSTFGNDYTDYYPYNSGIKKNDVTEKWQTWPDLVAKKLGYDLTYRNAISGSRLTKTSDSDDTAILSRIETSEDNIADAIILMGGLNDLWQGVDVNDYELALAQSLENLQIKNPGRPIVYALVVYDSTAKDYAQAAENVCATYGVTFIPISNMECISYHPTVKGMQQIANQIVNTILAD